MKTIIHSPDAPKAIGPYSQAVKANGVIYCSGQIPLDPVTMTLVSNDFTKQAIQVFTNLQKVTEEAGAKLADIVKLTIYLTDLSQFPIVNDVMQTFFQEPFPARTTVQISALPKAAQIEIDAIIVAGN